MLAGSFEKRLSRRALSPRVPLFIKEEKTMHIQKGIQKAFIQTMVSRPLGLLLISLAAGLTAVVPVHAQSATSAAQETEPRSVQRPTASALADTPQAYTTGPQPPEAAGSDAPENFRANYQITNVTQGHPRFRSAYSGANSLSFDGRTEETTDLTLFAGVRLAEHTELWLNPEIDQGFGFNNTLGVAGFPNGAAYKVGANWPYFRVHRAFVRHTIPLAGEDVMVEGGPNQLRSRSRSDNLVITVGKFAAVDIFDTNRYAHDPRADFLNWSIIDAGAFDYAADSWGYTFGAAAEWNKGNWTFRGGFFQLSEVPNGFVTGLHPNRHMIVVEAERRYEIAHQPGKMKLLGYVLRTRMGRYDDAIALASPTGDAPETSMVRRFQTRPGVVLNVEQQLTPEVGAFARLSANDGRYEAYEFTEINQSASAGLSIQGANWQRPKDTLGIAAVVNGQSSAAKRYFAAGGLGILIGDGAQTYAPEKIIELYYSARLLPALTATLDYQHVTSPAYNRDRGPVNIWGWRLHFEY